MGRFPEEAGTGAWTGNGRASLEKVGNGAARRGTAAHLHSDERQKEIN